MRAFAFALVLLMGCAPERDFAEEKDVRDAAWLTERLEGPAAEAAVESLLKTGADELKPFLFPILKVTVPCGDISASALYNPYRHAFSITFRDATSPKQELRKLTLDRTVVFQETKPFQGPKLTFGTASEVKKILTKVTDEHAALFPKGEDVTLDVRADVMAARPLPGKKFIYRPFTYRGWKVSLHVFTDAEQKAIDDHGKEARRAAARVMYLEKLGREVSALKRSKHPDVEAAVKTYDEAVENAQSALDQTRALPHPELKDSLKLERVPPCPTG